MKKFVIIHAVSKETKKIKCLVYKTNMFNNVNELNLWIDELCDACNYRKKSIILCDMIGLQVDVA